VRSLLRRIRRVWVTLGLMATVVFVGWSLYAYRARPEARAALESGAGVSVTRHDGYWALDAHRGIAKGLLFFPGALVDPVAYAPLVRTVADAGYPVVLVELPRRGAFGGADEPALGARARAAMASRAGVRRWIVAGHSLGGRVAARFVHDRVAPVAGLVLIGTSHPRDFSLADTGIFVTRVFGTRDTVADVEKQEATRANLPASTRVVRIDGGNHSQFGSYGFQPGDWPAQISRAEQQRLTVTAILEALDALK
jgi:pimeloyl-ACP methyl ester carboxylesterase